MSRVQERLGANQSINQSLLSTLKQRQQVEDSRGEPKTLTYVYICENLGVCVQMSLEIDIRHDHIRPFANQTYI